MKEHEFRYKENTEPAFNGYEPDNAHPAYDLVDKDKRIAELEGTLRDAKDGLVSGIYYARQSGDGANDTKEMLKTLTRINELLKG